MRFKFRSAILVLVVLLVLAGIHLYINTQNIGLKYKVTDLKIQLEEIRSQNRNLGSQVAQKENLAYIERVAKTRLNMIYPEKINYILSGSEEARF